jgi:dinuclear metal center YbgI/SA1388 family protein
MAPETTPATRVTVSRDRLVDELNAYLRIDEGSDYGPNGLQVEGTPEIARIVTGVSACQELFDRAVESEADAVLVHHGIFWEGMPRALTGIQYRRVATLIRAEVNLLAYHLPLDRHEEVGNNALAARAFGLADLQPFALHEGLPTGFRGRFPEPIPAAELARRCREIYGQEPRLLGDGPDPVTTLGIVSGGAVKEFWQALGAGLDAYITGEVSEWVMNVARETGTHYLAAGHYATERLGPKALGEKVARDYGVDVEFIDVPNPV